MKGDSIIFLSSCMIIKMLTLKKLMVMLCFKNYQACCEESKWRYIYKT